MRSRPLSDVFRRALGVLLSVLAMALLPAPAFAQDNRATGPAIIVFDGSGSMWGNIGTSKTPKFEMAREALRGSVATLSPRVRTGFLAFGHRRRGDCSDVEVMAAPEATPTTRIMTEADKVNPRGKGPLALALKTAAAQIPADAAGSIIAIHDGLDNCMQDICAAAGEIAAANPNTRIYLTAFGLAEPDTRRLACVADATRGKVIAAPDAAGLEAALSEAFTLANLERVDPASGVAVPAPQAAEPKAAGAPGLRLTAALKPGAPDISAPLRWTVAKADAPSDVVFSIKAPTLATDLEPGKYIVTAQLGQATARETVIVASDGPSTAQLSLNAGLLKIAAHADRNGAPLAEPLVTVSAKDGAGAASPVWVGRETPTELVVPAGSYSVRVEDGAADETVEVAVGAGAGAEVAPVLGTGRLELSAVEAGSGAAVDVVSFTIEEDDPDSPEGRREVARSANPNATFTLRAGTYYVQARAGSVETNDRVALGSGTVVKHVAQLNVVRLTVVAVTESSGEAAAGNSAAQRLVVLRILTLDNKREVARASGTTSEFRLPPARYMVEGLVSGTTIRAAGSVDLTSARDMRVQIKLESGEVKVVQGTSAGTHWRVRDARGRTVMHSGPGEANSARLAPGQYVLLSDTDGQRQEQAFELKAGERRELAVRTP